MPVESAADRAAFVNPDEFGLAATYALAAGGNTSLSGIFDEILAEGAGGNPGLATKVPDFLVRTADLPVGAKAGDRLTVGSRTFRVVNLLDPDGSGMTSIKLG